MARAPYYTKIRNFASGVAPSESERIRRRAVVLEEAKAGSESAKLLLRRAGLKMWWHRDGDGVYLTTAEVFLRSPKHLYILPYLNGDGSDGA